jgi:hypothetical protein
MCTMDANLVLTQRTQQTNAIASRRAEGTVTIAPAAAAAARHMTPCSDSCNCSLAAPA